MHLFAGGGGGMYADLILGHTPVVAVEWEAYCCDVLRARKEEGWWPDCEIIEGDIRAFDGSRWKGKVDCIHAGWPCTDISVIGGKAGLQGKASRLFFEAARVIGEVLPPYVYLENVADILTADEGEALGQVLGALAALGYDIEWIPLPASDVGPQLKHRDRWWCLARASGGRRDEKPLEAARRSNTTRGCSESANAWKRRYATEPCLDRVVNDVACRRERSDALGNGQVPLQAAYAWVMLGGPTDAI